MEDSYESEVQMDINYPVFSKLFGRLGNNLFQIATGLAHSVRQKTDFFIIPEHEHWNYNQYLRNPIPERPTKLALPVYSMPDTEFAYKPIPNHFRILRGYFQSEKYFKEHKTNICSLIEFNDRYSYMSANQVAVHVRRGDYLNLGMYHPVLSPRYYRRAFEQFGKDKEYVVFSDDVEWVENIFIPHFSDYNIRVVISNKVEGAGLVRRYDNEFFELKMMSTFQNFIIANSSFSWWGAWLSNAKNKRVIAPSLWFGPNYSHLDIKDLLPEEWIKC